ncbi:MAG: LicD family protein [Christensenellales bacterium]|jgi:lipopolysaccharide cholinephosphotransferase
MRELLQHAAFEILCEFDSFCQKHGLTYYLCAGTLLGAVRHGGFIPWDDDIDVSMPRADYDRLLILGERFPSHLVLMHHNNTVYYPLNFAKLVNKNTTVVEQGGQNNYNIRGVYIDIFPIDGAGATYKRAVRRRKRASLYRHLIPIAANIPDNKKRPLYKRILMCLIRKLDAKRLQNSFDKFLRKKPFARRAWVAVYVGAYGIKEIMEKRVYGEPSRIAFCGRQFNAPADVTAYLSRRFGDYMSLPPVEKRSSGHNFIYVNLNLPFGEYDKNIHF